MKKIRTLLTSLIVLLCALTTSAHDFEVDGIYYNITSNTDLTVGVTDDPYEYSGSVVIPEKVTYNGKEYSVTSIVWYAFEGCSGLTSVTIPNSVTSIGDDAFKGCSGLLSVTIPNSVTSIGWSVFEGCSGLASVTIPNSVTSIGDYAFNGCKNLISVTIPNSVTSIGNSAFSGCSSLISVTIGNSVTSIGYYAFSGCSSLAAVHITDLSAWCKIKFIDNPTGYAHHLYLNGEEITNLVIPDDVTSIGNSAFECCSSLTSVTIPNSVTSIGHYTFSGCSGLTSVTIPNSVTSIGHYTFSGCSGMTSVTIPNSVTSIGDYAFFGCSGLTSMTIPNSVTSIGNHAFEGCSGLAAVHITDLSAWCKIEFVNSDSNPTSYAHHLYLNGEEIFNLVIPDDITNIGGSAFSYCYGLTSVTIPNSVTSIGDGAFNGCLGLISVTIGNSVTSIGDEAFEGCSGLTSVRIEEGESTLPLRNDVFSSCPLTTLYLGRNISYTVSGSSTPFSGKKKLSVVTIGNNVTNIGEYLFYGCSALASVTILESCKTIQRNAFRDCNNLQELTLPSTCIACYDYSFYGCSSLKNINCQAEIPPAAYKNTFSSSIYTKATLNVPEGCADKYKAANIWKEFTNMTAGGVVPEEPKQCAAPVITYADGKLQFACETEGAEYRYTLTDTDIKSVYTDVTNSAVNLSACYTIKAYAYADGYTNSEQVTATLYWIDGSDVSTNINQTEMRGVMAICSGGIITVSGLTDGETVMFYDANGTLLYTGTAQNGIISYAPSASGVIIVKIGTTSIKLVS